jgi:signal transduction histidine kinase
MRWPLRYQILFPFAAVMLAVVVSLSLLEAYLSARRTQRQIEHQLQEVALTLADATFPLTDAVLKQTRGLSGAEFVLTDRRGAVEAASLKEVEPASLPQTVTPRDQVQLGQGVELGGQAYFHTAIDLRPRGAQRETMRLHILYPQGVLREARWQAAYPPLWVGAGLLGVVIAMAFAIAGRFSRPILEVRRELSRLVQGDFRPVPLGQRNDELRDLIGCVNALGDQLEEMRRVIKRSERLALLGQLSGGLAHQLRNSVAGARMAVQLHQRRCGDVDQDSLAVALRQLTMTEQHLQRFLTAGQTTLTKREPCELRAIVADVVSLVAPTCRHRDVALQCDADAAPCPLSADAEQLRQLILNLAVNAIEAAGRDGWVRIELSQTAAATIIRVVDNGPGPAPEVAQRLFEPFASGKPEGIGLGLTVAKKIAESHGGTIHCTTEGATTFEVVLPSQPADDARSQAAAGVTETHEQLEPAAGP